MILADAMTWPDVAMTTVVFAFSAFCLWYSTRI